MSTNSLLRRGLCKICGKLPATQKHHIRPGRRILVCEKCHKKLNQKELPKPSLWDSLTYHHIKIPHFSERRNIESLHLPKTEGFELSFSLGCKRGVAAGSMRQN